MVSIADRQVIIGRLWGQNQMHSQLLIYQSKYFEYCRDANFQKTWTWTDYHQDVRTVAKAFISLGFARLKHISREETVLKSLHCNHFLSRFDSVCILGFNAPEWVISDVAAIFAGGFAAGIYPTNGPEVEIVKNYYISLLFLSSFLPTQACKYILEQSSCSILVVEDGRQLDKVWALRDQLPNLKKVHILPLIILSRSQCLNI